MTIRTATATPAYAAPLRKGGSKVGVEVKNPQYGDTHLLKGDVPKEVYEQWTEEQRQAQPILGNVRPIGPKQQAVTGSVDMNAPEGQQQDDLPF